MFLNLNESKTMNELMKRITRPTLLLILLLFQLTSALAQSDHFIKAEIEAQLAESEKMRNAKIEVHVEQRLVVLSGTTRLYEQRLISERIAWTVPGVSEVDNEIRVVPILPMPDAAIEWEIKQIVKFNISLHAAGIMAVVKDGAVTIQGSFSEISALIFLKHEVAKIEGVVDIKFTGKVIARSSITQP
jgi:osmotically-inducible protein OsmY